MAHQILDKLKDLVDTVDTATITQLAGGLVIFCLAVQMPVSAMLVVIYLALKMKPQAADAQNSGSDVSSSQEQGSGGSGTVEGGSRHESAAGQGVSQSTMYCGICKEEKSPEFFFKSAKGTCSHRYCKDCEYSHAKFKVMENQVDERLCCPHEGCTRPWSDDEILRALKFGEDGGDLEKQFHERRLDALLGPNAGFRKCPFPTCNYFFEWSPGDFAKFECPSCRESFCLQCSAVGPNRPVGPGHEGSCHQRRHLLEQDEAERKKLQEWLLAHNRDEQEFLKYLQQAEGTRPCPGCKEIIEKDEGCQHMTCKCGHEFCWDCGADRKVIVEHDNRWHKPSCPHYAACSDAPRFQPACPECKRLGRICDFPSDDGYPESLMASLTSSGAVSTAGTVSS